MFLNCTRVKWKKREHIHRLYGLKVESRREKKTEKKKERHNGKNHG